MKKILQVLMFISLANTMFAQTNEHSPFVQYGYDKPIVYTASYGMFEEFHDFLDTVEIGNILFDCVNNIIVGFLSEEEMEVRADILPLSVDPHADRYWWVTPYAYCNNNPIKIVDPDGRDIITVDEKGGITIEKCTGNDILKSTTTHKTKELSGNGIFRAEGVQFSQKKDEHGNLKETTISGLSRSDARKVFSYFGDNTKVEWGYMESSNSNGGTDIFVGSSHEAGREATIAKKVYEKGINVLRYDHSHPVLHANDVDGYRYSMDDEKFWNAMNEKHPNASAGIRFQGKYDLYYINGNTTKKYNNSAYKYKQ